MRELKKRIRKANSVACYESAWNCLNTETCRVQCVSSGTNPYAQALVQENIRAEVEYAN